MTTSRPNVFTIPAGESFVDALARGLMAEADNDPLALSAMLVLLPNRRACRALREAFLRCSGGAPLLLPRLTPLGEADEDELALLGDEAAALDLAPAIPLRRRRLLLARRIVTGGTGRGGRPPTPEQAVRLAGELGSLLDQVQTEGLSFDRLARLVPDDYAEHWQITLDFLAILTEHWPKILAEEGWIDAADRRNRLLDAQSAAWTAAAPPFPVVAAGSTGSIPAAARLLSVVARLPRGRLVLPGLDRRLDEADRAAIDHTHPQYGLMQLLQRLDTPPEAVKDWPGCAAGPRAWLIGEAMRPAATSERWRELAAAPPLGDALAGVERLDCPGPREEAGAIALMLRHALESEGRTAALVTPDRDLARRVSAELRRYGIEIDDSAGRPLALTPPGAFLLLTALMVAEDFAPHATLAALKHPLAAGGAAGPAFRSKVRRLERAALRGPRPAPGLAGLAAALGDDHGLAAWLGSVAEAAAPFARLMAAPAAPLAELLRAHLAFAEALAADDRQPGAARLWRGDAGEAAAAFATQLAEAAGALGAPNMTNGGKAAGALGAPNMTNGGKAAGALGAPNMTNGGKAAGALGAPNMTSGGKAAGALGAPNMTSGGKAADTLPPVAGAAYPGLLRGLMEGSVVRPTWGGHPRLAIWGPLEARLQHADLLILGGLNEGVWPPEAVADAWMSRPMRQAFGLPPPERRIGLAAHDFAQAFAAPAVVLTRAARVDGTPTVPSRWLLRLDTVLASGREAHPTALWPSGPWAAWHAALDRPPRFLKPAAPAPRPPLAARPRSLSATAVETWMRDPYAIYARKILDLEALEPIDADPGAADYGSFVHAALDAFLKAHPAGPLPANALDRLLATGRASFGEALARPGLWAFWWPRFERLAAWFVAHEAARRHELAEIHSEVSGALEIIAAGGPFRVTAKADRIDLLRDGSLVLIDYKTGAPPSVKEVAAGYAPQLPIEAAIARHGGFPGVAGDTIGRLLYWRLAGGEPGGSESAAGDDPARLAAEALDGLTGLIAAFDDETTPYAARPHPDRAPKYSDYLHLARVKEWSTSEEGEE
jgi:ATP-dependent helicase/nuclease subunit B